MTDTSIFDLIKTLPYHRFKMNDYNKKLNELQNNLNSCNSRLDKLIKNEYYLTTNNYPTKKLDEILGKHERDILDLQKRIDDLKKEKVNLEFEINELLQKKNIFQ